MGPMLVATLIIFLNRDGGHYVRGGNDARLNEADVILRDADIPAFPYGDASWRAYAGCMRGLFAPYDVVVTEEDPGNTPHVEVVGVRAPQDIDLPVGVRGVAPFACGAPAPSPIVLWFASTLGDDPRLICEEAARELGHTVGLDHTFACPDVMSTVEGCGAKSFTAAFVPCGEVEARPCTCDGGERQNAHARLLSVVGARPEAGCSVGPRGRTPWLVLALLLLRRRGLAQRRQESSSREPVRS